MKQILRIPLLLGLIAVGLGATPGRSSALTSDDFSQPAFDGSLWNFINPHGDAVLEQAAGLLTLNVPGDMPHLAGQNGNTSVRLLQSIADGDFEIEVKFESLPNEVEQIQGLVAEQDATNYVCLDVRSSPGGLVVTCTAVRRNFPQIRGRYAVRAGDGLYLRLSRQAGRWAGRFSADGQQWTLAADFTHELDVGTAGILVGNDGYDHADTERDPDDPVGADKAADTPAAPFQVRVDFFFDTANPINPEDGQTGTGTRSFLDLRSLYLFRSGGGTVFDFSPNGPSLDLRIADTSAVSWLPGGGLVLEAPTLLTSLAPADKVNAACVASGEITLEAWVDPATVAQSGPARILTVSGDPSNRNATLGHGQWGTLPSTVFDVRLRTTTSTDNGQPDLVSPAGSLTGELQHVVYTRDDQGTATIFIDGQESVTGTAGGTLDNWNPGYPLGIGSELDGTRSWLGAIHLAAVYSRALDPGEVQDNFLAGPAGGVLPSLPPVAALDGLNPGDSFYFDQTITLVADAADADGSVAKVEFFAGETLLATCPAPPYRFDWSHPTPGSHQIRAVATDDAGYRGASDVIPLLVEVNPEFLGAPFISDDFSDASLGQPWALTDGTDGASANQIDGHLIVTLPPSTQNPWDASARVFFAHQPGSPDDIALEVKLATEDFGEGAFAGLRFAGTGGEIVQLLAQRDEGSWTVAWGQSSGGPFGNLGSVPVAPAGDGLWLQVRRTGPDWTCFHSTDGRLWIAAAAIFQPLSLDRVGIVGGSLDAAGEPTAAFDYVFNLASPINPEDGESGDHNAPVIGPISVTPALDRGLLSWQTNEEAFFRVAYGLTTGYEAGLLLGETFATQHQVAIEGLAQGQAYHFRITCIDTAGNIGTSDDRVFHTDLEAVLAPGPAAGAVYRETRQPIGVRADDWRVTDPDALNPGAADFLPNPVLSIDVPDLAGAVRAELIIDRWSGHPGTSHKRIRLNGASWLHLPAPATIPGSNPECYMYQDNLMIGIPLNQLRDGSISLEGTADRQTCNSFDWGQWGWYAAVLRVYYDETIPHATGSITSPAPGSAIVDSVAITVGTTGDVAEIEVLARYEGFDSDGDGLYSGWHRDYRGDDAATTVTTHGIVGSDDTAPFEITWDASWIPDQQPGSVALQARIRDQEGVWYVADFVTGLSLEHLDREVRQYRLLDVPPSFWVRDGSMKTATFEIPAAHDLTLATGARLTASTWNGIDTGVIDINGLWSVGDFGADHFLSRDEFTVPASALVQGVNNLNISATTIHHGMEVLWPGPVVTVSFAGSGQVTAPAIPAEGEPVIAWTEPRVGSGSVTLGLESQGPPRSIHGFRLEIEGVDEHGVLAMHSPLEESGTFATVPVDGRLGISFTAADSVTMSGRLLEITFDVRVLDGKGALRARLAVDAAAPIDLPEAEWPALPTRFDLGPNYPNPFNPTTRIDFALPIAGPVRLRVFDLRGKLVRTLLDRQLPAGFHGVDWHGNDDQGRSVASGVYFYRLEAPGFSRTLKLMLVK